MVWGILKQSTSHLQIFFVRNFLLLIIASSSETLFFFDKPKDGKKEFSKFLTWICLFVAESWFPIPYQSNANKVEKVNLYLKRQFESQFFPVESTGLWQLLSWNSSLDFMPIFPFLISITNNKHGSEDMYVGVLLNHRYSFIYLFLFLHLRVTQKALQEPFL